MQEMSKTRLRDIRLSENTVLNDILKSAVIMMLATLLSSALYDIGLRVENILMIYAVSVLIIINETQKLFWGALSAVLCMLLFNFFFTELFSASLKSPLLQNKFPRHRVGNFSPRIS
jgi:K+-sensing histidine kinase KdpD